MTIELVIGGVVGAGVLYVWSFRRLQYVRAVWSYRKRSAAFEHAFRTAREEMLTPRYARLATADDAELFTRLDANDQAALAGCGFTTLGDLVVQADGGPPAWFARAFLDRAGTTTALVMSTPRVALAFTTYTEEGWFTSRRSAPGGFAVPPFGRVQVVADLPVATIAQRHCTFADADDPGRVQIATIDELLARIDASRERVARWRQAQPPDELLDADLKAALGAQYPRIGKMWRRRLRDRLPEATLRRG